MNSDSVPLPSSSSRRNLSMSAVAVPICGIRFVSVRRVALVSLAVTDSAVSPSPSMGSCSILLLVRKSVRSRLASAFFLAMMDASRLRLSIDAAASRSAMAFSRRATFDAPNN